MEKFRKIILMMGVAILIGLVGLVSYGAWRGSQPIDDPTQNTDDNSLPKLEGEADYGKYDANAIIPADEWSGNLPENIEGSPDAEVLIFEYADFQCNHCAEWSTTVSRLVEKYDGRVAVVFRSFMIGFTNSEAAARAANAAAIQGYWVEFKNLLFANQNVWAYLSGSKLRAEFEKYFELASNGKGDVEKFYDDMKGEATRRKAEFDTGIAKELKLRGTPTFIIGGEKVSPTELQNVIEKKLK